MYEHTHIGLDVHKESIAARLDSRPRKRLGFRTPEECCGQTRETGASECSRLHFKLELRRHSHYGIVIGRWLRQTRTTRTRSSSRR